MIATIGLFDFEDYDALYKYGENLYEPTDVAVRIDNATGSINARYESIKPKSLTVKYMGIIPPEKYMVNIIISVIGRFSLTFFLERI